MNNEDNLLHEFDSSESVATDTDAIEIDYKKIEDSYYNALKRIEYEESLQEDVTVNNDSDLVEFSSQTDANLYTVGVVAPPTTCAEQSTAYLLDIRNILLIFLFGYFCLSVYSKLKTTLINYTK